MGPSTEVVFTQNTTQSLCVHGWEGWQRHHDQRKQSHRFKNLKTKNEVAPFKRGRVRCNQPATIPILLRVFIVKSFYYEQMLNFVNGFFSPFIEMII
jgi:hypothetical protein